MVLQNYVILQTGVPARLHFTDHTIEARTVTDPRTMRPKTVNVLVLTVDRLNGEFVNGYYSTMAEKHATQFAAFLDGRKYQDYDFLITKRGDGFQTAWTVETIPVKR